MTAGRAVTTFATVFFVGAALEICCAVAVIPGVIVQYRAALTTLRRWASGEVSTGRVMTGERHLAVERDA